MLLTCAVVVGANAMYALQIQRALLTCAVAGGVDVAFVIDLCCCFMLAPSI